MILYGDAVLSYLDSQIGQGLLGSIGQGGSQALYVDLDHRM